MDSGLLARAPFNVEMAGFLFSDHPGTATLKDGRLSDHVFQVNFDRGGSQVEINFEGALASSTGGHSKGSAFDLSIFHALCGTHVSPEVVLCHASPAARPWL